MKPNTVGELRAQAAYVEADAVIEVFWTDSRDSDGMPAVEIVRCFADTMTLDGRWKSSFKIELRRKR